jgi:3-oxoacyl-[acyl-carrier-protein] synthase II
MNKTVAITGIGIVSPNGIGKADFTEATKKGISGIGRISLFDTSALQSISAGEIKGFTPEDFLGKKGLRVLNRSTKLALTAAKLAFIDAGLKQPVEEKDTHGYGVCIGTAIGSVHSVMEFDKEAILEGPNYTNPSAFPNTVMNAAGSYISIWFNIKGFNATIASSLCSGLDAIYYAASQIQNYDYKIALAGAVEELCLETFLGFYKTGYLSGSRKNTSEYKSAPFDKNRNGVIFGEGACILILEELKHALDRGASIYALIGGYGSSFDVRSRRISNPRGEAAARSMKKSLENSGIHAQDIDYICASANSTVDGDISESEAISSVFKDDLGRIPVTCIKSMIGETFSAGGAFNAASSAITIAEGFIPPTINYNTPDERCRLNIVSKQPMGKKVKKALVNSFSATGANSALVISSAKI